MDFKKSCRLLTVKIDGEHESRHALLTFTKSEDAEKALAFVSTKSLYGTRLKAELYEGVTNGRVHLIVKHQKWTSGFLENEECDIMKRSLCSESDIDEYSVRATRTLYIGNLQSEISYNELRETYSAYGDIIVRSGVGARRRSEDVIVFSLFNRSWKLNDKRKRNISYRSHSFNTPISRAW